MSEDHSSGTTPLPTDTERTLLVKILEAINAGGGGGGGITTGATVGVVDPEGAVTGSPGALYWNRLAASFWVKEFGTGNTGWNQIV